MMAETVNKIPMSELQDAKVIGRGSYSTVYQMTWTRQLGAIQVAAKKIYKPDDDIELKMLSRLDHPNVIKLLGVVDEGINFLLILELCEGSSLRSYLNGYQEDRLPTDQFFNWAKQAALPIEYLKRMGVVHKDIKSPNILITQGNILKLADFGLAKDMAHTTYNATESASYPWMAPELLRVSVLSPSYDIFGYGVVLWELWTLQFPFKELKPVQIIWKVCEKDERLPIPDNMPKPIAALISQCWEKDWKKRPSIQQIISQITTIHQIEAGPWVLNKGFGQESYVIGIVINPSNGDIAVLEGFSSVPPVRVYSSEGEYKFNFGEQDGIYSVHQIAISADGATFFTTANPKYIKMYDIMGNYKGQWVSSHASSHDVVAGLAINTKGQVLVGDNISKCITTHNQDGSYIASIKVDISPNYLAVTSQDTIIVASARHPPKIVSNTGDLIHTLKHPTDVSHWDPRGVDCYNDIIFIANYTHGYRNQILCYSVYGTYLGTLPLESITYPAHIAFTPDGTKAIVGSAKGCYMYLLPS